jgi:hypothetical protein
MILIDSEKMAPGLRQIAGNKGTQDSKIAYTLHHTDGNLNVLKSVFDFYLKVYIQFCAEFNSLSNGI